MSLPSPSELARGEPPTTAQSRPALYSPGDVERFVRETNLCTNCQTMFDSKVIYGKVYVHHPSIDSLQQSAQAGCQICIKVHKKWTAFDENDELKSTQNQPISLHFSLYPRTSPFRGLFFSAVGPAPGFYCSYTLIQQDFSIVASDIVPVPGPDSRLPLIKHWVDSCRFGDESHWQCSRSRSPCPKPTRLLYLNTYQKDIVRLISVNPEYQYSYVTLSHRWGSPEPPKLSLLKDAHKQGRLSMETLQAGVRVADLPQTFRDAMRIVQECGLEYIWIDSLCIIQDVTREGSNVDWETEARKMGHIYKGGVFNIVAAGAKNSHAGLFPRQDRVLSPVVRVPSDGTTERGNKDIKVLHEKPSEEFATCIMISELLSRGWVYQEILQTPANLFCTENQLWWSCFSSSCSQTFPWGMLCPETRETFCDDIREQKLSTQPGKGGNFAPTRWNYMIRLYSRTSVTVPDDRLVALAGIADLYVHDMRLLGEGVACYHSGVWSIEAVPQLLWRIDGKLPSSRLPASHPIPSWSPLCHGEVRLCHPSIWRSALHIVKYVSMATSGLDRVGRCRTREDGTLKLQGVLVDTGFSGHYDWLFPRGYKAYKAQIWWDNSGNRELAKADKGPSWCVLVCAAPRPLCGLLLRACDDSPGPTKKSRIWQRCGYFEFHHEYPDYLTKYDLDVVSRAFGLDRHGLRLCRRDGVVKLQYAGAALDLEDVYII